jgi:ribosomal protein S18 acetylase RimI-like enzyme
LGAYSGLVALEQEQLLGFLGWILVDEFRGTQRKAAYCPEWGHAAPESGRPATYRALYREASRQWQAAGCQVHALTILAHERDTLETWFWNGFGLTVVDAIRNLDPLDLGADHSAAIRPIDQLDVGKAIGAAIRPIDQLDVGKAIGAAIRPIDQLNVGKAIGAANRPPDAGVISPGANVSIRKGTPDDLQALSSLEIEHRRHYSKAPVFMAPVHPPDKTEIANFLQTPENSYWLADEGDGPVGFLRFERRSEGATLVVAADTTIAITGAYFRPGQRGRGLAAQVLDAALKDYAAQGFERCSVDFESFNPEAAKFWMKYFQPVCYSVVRVPES